MQAHELKVIADQANKAKEDPEIKTGYHLVLHKLKSVAECGAYSYTFNIQFLNVDLKIWKEIAKLLEKDGFKVKFDREITAMYSNTDWDDEEVVKVSWL